MVQWSGHGFLCGKFLKIRYFRKCFVMTFIDYLTLLWLSSDWKGSITTFVLLHIMQSSEGRNRDKEREPKDRHELERMGILQMI